jgi:hypothetical protein
LAFQVTYEQVGATEIGGQAEVVNPAKGAIGPRQEGTTWRAHASANERVKAYKSGKMVGDL